MADLTFDEAVEVAQLSQEASSLLAPPNLTDYTVRYYFEAPPEIRKALLIAWLDSSKKDRETWDVVNKIAQRHLRSGGPMTRELAEWVAERLADQLEGKRQRPAKPGPSRGANAVRDKVIASVVQMLVARGFHATRNRLLTMKTDPKRASAEGGSACDVVGVALGMGYKAVEKVWTSSKPSDRELLRNALNALFASYEMQRNK